MEYNYAYESSVLFAHGTSKTSNLTITDCIVNYNNATMNTISLLYANSYIVNTEFLSNNAS